jgi:hypothetical protein
MNLCYCPKQLMNIDVLYKSQISTDEEFHRLCRVIHQRFSRAFIDDMSNLDTMEC